MNCKRCGSDDNEMQLMVVTTLNGEERFLCQKCGEMNKIMADHEYSNWDGNSLS